MASAPRRGAAATLWIVCAALVAFGGSLFSAFHLDDYGMLQDPAIVLPGGWVRCFGLLQTRPLTWFTFWANYQLSGRDPLLWHAVNLVLHACCAVVLYRVLNRLLPRAALLAALLFAVHPMQAESVDYVYARAILLCTLFSLFALDAWIRERYWIAVSWFALALLSKEECVTLPLALACVTGLRLSKARLAALAAMLGLALLAGIRVIAAIQISGVKNIGPSAGITPLHYLSQQGIAILRYFGLLIFPWSFTVDPQIPDPALIWRLLAWLVLLSLIGVAVMRWRDTKAAAWILAGFLLLIPSSSIFPAADLAADRRMYLPMLAFAPVIALILPRKRTILLLPCLLVALAMERTYVWSSDARLWSEAVELAPEKLRPRLQLSRVVPPEQALQVLREAETFAPQAPEVPTELARVYLDLHRPAEALAQAGRALALTPREPHALNNRGVVLLAMNQTAAARRDFLAALQLDSCLVEARDNLQRSGGIPADAPHCTGH